MAVNVNSNLKMIRMEEPHQNNNRRHPSAASMYSNGKKESARKYFLSAAYSTLTFFPSLNCLAPKDFGYLVVFRVMPNFSLQSLLRTCSRLAKVIQSEIFLNKINISLKTKQFQFNLS